jgi:DNA-binding NtrC family response regulator
LMQRKIIALGHDESTLVQISHVLTPRFVLVRTQNPSQAIARLRKDRDIQVFLMDQALAKSGGMDLMETVRTIRPEVRRIMLTNFADLTTLVAGLHSGAVQYLAQKPIRAAELLAIVDLSTRPCAITTP